MKPRKKIVALGAVVALSLTACSGSKDPNSSKELVNGATFTIALGTDPGSLNPLTNSSFYGNPYFPAALAYDTLISSGKDGDVQPLLAEKWEATTTSATFTLRSGITCADGSPLTASDVAANINYVGEEKSKSPLAGTFVQLGTKATADDSSRTVKLVSGAPDAFLLNDVGSLPIVCAKGLKDQKILEEGTDGTGLFKLTSAVPGNSYTLQRRTDYAWGPGDWKNNQDGLPDKIVVKIVPNTTTEANLLLAGDANFAIALKPTDNARLTSMFKEEPLVPTGVFLFNEGAGHPTADQGVRKALVTALDLPKLGKVIGGGTGSPTTQINQGTLPNLCPANTTKGNVPSHNVDEAKSLLDKAGWTVGAGGIRSKDGTPLTIEFPVFSAYPPFTSASELMQTQLKAIGVDLKPKPANGPTYSTALSNGDFDILLQSWTFPTPSQMVPYYIGNSIEKGGNNFGEIHNAEYESLVKQASEKVGQDGCDLWNQAEVALIKAVDVMPFWSNPGPAFGSGATFSLLQFTWSIRMHAK